MKQWYALYVFLYSYIPGDVGTNFVVDPTEAIEVTGYRI